MDIYEALKKDHAKVLDILEKLEATSDRAGKTRQKQFEKLKDELLPHMLAEEKYFYVYILDKITDRQKRRTMLEGIEEHRAARSVLRDCEKAGFSDESWQPDITVLREVVSHHIRTEEDTVFEIAREIIDDPDRLGENFSTVKKDQAVGV